MNSFLKFPGTTFRLAQLKENQSADLGKGNVTDPQKLASLPCSYTLQITGKAMHLSFAAQIEKNSYIHFPVHNPVNDPIRQVSLDETNCKIMTLYS